MFDIETKGAADSPFAPGEFNAPVSGSTWNLSPLREARWAIAFALLQVAILVVMIVLDGLPLVLGERVRLKVVPVDPRDLFRGDYVVLDYGFGPRSGPVWGLPDSKNWYDASAVGREVYISLKPEGDHHVVEQQSVHPPASGPYIHGRIGYGNRIDCGIDAYYVQEGEGLVLEQAIRERRVLAEVAVWRGKAKLVRLIP